MKPLQRRRANPVQYHEKVWTRTAHPLTIAVIIGLKFSRKELVGGSDDALKGYQLSGPSMRNAALACNALGMFLRYTIDELNDSYTVMDVDMLKVVKTLNGGAAGNL